MTPENEFTRRLEVKDLRTGQFAPIEFKDVKPGMVFREVNSPHYEYGAINYPTKTHDIFGWTIESFKLPATLYGDLDMAETLVRIVDATTFDVIPKDALKIGDTFVTSFVEHFIFRVTGVKTIVGLDVLKLTVVPFPEEQSILTQGGFQKQINDALSKMNVYTPPVFTEGRGSTYPFRPNNPNERSE